MHQSSERIRAIVAALARAWPIRRRRCCKVAQGVMAFNKLSSSTLLRLVKCGDSFTGNLGVGPSSKYDLALSNLATADGTWDFRWMSFSLGKSRSTGRSEVRDQ